MKKTFNKLAFRKSLVWFVRVMLTLTALQSKVIAPPINSYEATEFLEKFGYMRKDRSDSSLMSMRSANNAILDYQKYMGLDETGVLDDTTLTMMSKPRCGVKDKFDYDDLTRRKRYVREGSKRAGDLISYRISKYPKRIKDRRLVDREIARAFKVWRYQTPLRFHQRKNGRADIDIRFEEKDHRDGTPFDGPGWTLAHATPPKRNSFIHFDDEEEWTIDEYSGKNLFQVAVHEIGHSLGLLHSEYKNTLMFPNYNETGGPGVTLDEDDINGIHRLYGDMPTRDICAEVSDYYTIDAATTTEDGKTYIFRGKYYWEVVRGEDRVARQADGAFPRRISDDWNLRLPYLVTAPVWGEGPERPFPKLPGELDAALTWPNGQTFFFKRDKYWSFKNKVMDPGYPKLISEGFEGIPMNIDAAFMWNNRTFFFKGTNFWEYDSQKTPPVSSEYPRPISDMEGVPDYVDAALQFTDQRTYLFKGFRHYILNNELTVNAQQPRSDVINIEWFGCPFYKIMENGQQVMIG